MLIFNECLFLKSCHCSVRLFATPWTAVCQASLSFTISQGLNKFMSLESVILSNHLILCHSHLLLPSILLSIRGFSNESNFKCFKLCVSYLCFLMDELTTCSSPILMGLIWTSFINLNESLPFLTWAFRCTWVILICFYFIVVLYHINSNTLSTTTPTWLPWNYFSHP